MFDIATSLLAGASALAGTGVLAGHAWRSSRLGTRFAGFTQRLNDIETVIYTHQEPAEPVPFRAADFSLSGASGNLVGLDRLRSLGKPVLLVFTDPHGATGAALLSRIGAWQGSNGAPLTVVGIGPAGSPLPAARSVPAGVTDLLAPPAGGTVAAELGVMLTPAAVLIRPNGAVVGKPVVGLSGIDAMLASLATAAAEAALYRQQSIETGAPRVGTRAPLVILPDLGDNDHEVVAGNREQILLFWSPDCGYCDQLVPELRALDPARTSAITLVARGSEAANREQALGFRTLIDHDLSASTAFGVSGTPAAILVRSDGTVGSPVARGIRDVRAFLSLDGSPTVSDA